MIIVTKWDLVKDITGITFFTFVMIICIWLFNYQAPDLAAQFLVYLISIVGTVTSCIVIIGYCAMLKDDWYKYKFVQEYR